MSSIAETVTNIRSTLLQYKAKFGSVIFEETKINLSRRLPQGSASHSSRRTYLETSRQLFVCLDPLQNTCPYISLIFYGLKCVSSVLDF